MKLRFIVVVAAALALCASFDVFAQKDKKRKKNLPRTEVVELESEIKPIVVAVPPQEQPANGSLFTPNAANVALVADFIAGRVGDLVFVDVVETSAANVISSASRKRDSGTLGGVGTVAGALPLPGAAVAGAVVGALGQRKYDGSGATQRRSDVRARITARVVEVLPNGDLRVEALKLVKINRENEQIALSGIVRRRDLAADNSIPTVLVGDLRVEYNGKGIASADNAPGWLFRLFEKITPF